MGLRTYLSTLSISELDKIREYTNFSEEEREIFELIVKGKSINEIAFEMNISESSVSRKIKKIDIKQEECMNTKGQVPVWEKLNLTVEEAAAYSNIGQGTLRDLLRKPNCPFVLYIGSKMLIKRKAFEQFVNKEIEI